MNDYWNSSEVMISEDAMRSNGYTDKIYRIIKCGPSEHTDNRISFDDIFEMKEMIRNYLSKESVRRHFSLHHCILITEALVMQLLVLQIQKHSLQKFT